MGQLRLRPIMNWLVPLALIYAVLVCGMYIFQRDFLYFPDKVERTPADVGFTGVQQITVSTSDGQTLQAWYLQAKPGNPTILHFHGNAGSIADRSERLRFYQRHGAGALFVSYRGYGTSSGSPSEAGLINDALASYAWLRSVGLEPRDIVLVGESLGAAVAVQLAARQKVAAMVLEAPFTSTVEVAKSLYWWLPVDLLMKDRFESIKAIGKIHVPVLIVHGENDEITNVSLGQKLFDAASQPKEFHLVEGSTHNAIFNKEVWQNEQAFIAKFTRSSTN